LPARKSHSQVVAVTAGTLVFIATVDRSFEAVTLMDVNAMAMVWRRLFA
jgi:hypothetical protein